MLPGAEAAGAGAGVGFSGLDVDCLDFSFFLCNFWGRAVGRCPCPREPPPAMIKIDSGSRPSKLRSTWEEKITHVPGHREGICRRVGLHGGIERTSWRQDNQDDIRHQNGSFIITCGVGVGVTLTTAGGAAVRGLRESLGRWSTQLRPGRTGGRGAGLVLGV